MLTNLEEPDIIIIQHCYGVLSNVCSSAKAISDDMKVLVLLVFFTCNKTVRCLFSWRTVTVVEQLRILQQL